MKFIEKLFGKKQTENIKVKLNTNDLLRFISDESEKEFNEIKPFIRRKYEDIELTLHEIPEVIESLLSAEVIENANKRVEKVGDANRDNIANNLLLITEKVKPPEDASIQSAFNFCINAKSALKTVRDNTHRSQLYIKAIYPVESQKIISTLANIEDQVDELFVPVRDKKNRKDSFDKFSEEIGNYERIQVQIQDSHTNIGHLESRIDSIKKDKLDTKNRLNELENSQEFERAKQLEADANTLKEQLSNTDHDIQRIFSPLSKVFSRMEKQDKSEICVLSPEHRQILEKITHDPASALEHDLDSFFAEVRPRIENGSLGLKDQMCEKALQQVEKLHNSKDLSSLREKRKEYSLQLENAMNELSSLIVYRDKEQFVQQISRDEHMLKTLEVDLNTEKKHFDTLTEDSELLESGLSMEVKGLFEKDIEIEY